MQTWELFLGFVHKDRKEKVNNIHKMNYMYYMVADHWRRIKLQSGFNKDIKIAPGKSWREEEEKTIITPYSSR